MLFNVLTSLKSITLIFSITIDIFYKSIYYVDLTLNFLIYNAKISYGKTFQQAEIQICFLRYMNFGNIEFDVGTRMFNFANLMDGANFFLQVQLPIYYFAYDVNTISRLCPYHLSDCVWAVIRIYRVLKNVNLSNLKKTWWNSLQHVYTCITCTGILCVMLD